MKRFTSLLFEAVLVVIISFILFDVSLLNISANSTSSINFQGKIAIKGTGTNITTDAPACIQTGADTCDLRISYFSVSTAGTSLYTEVFSDVELGDYFGVFNLALGLGNKTGGSETDFTDVFIKNDSVFINIEFDATGSGDFSSPEVFTVDGSNRMQLRATPFAITAANISASNNQIIRNQTNEQADASFNIDGSGTIAGDFSVDGANNTFYVDSTSHNVGIGTASPAQKLHVSGDVRIDGLLELSPTQINNVLQASDAEDTDRFGFSTSLSADGSVLAVGARTWEGSSGTDRGGVYIYDWSGSTWVQRGSVLVASDAADNDSFGQSTSLSADGSILVVGATGWEGSTGTDRGGVYIYDWSGSTWVQRGSVLEASDAANSDNFGYSTSLSADGSVLIVSATAREGSTGTNRGGVYIYDWSGSAWGQRGSVLEASDAADYDFFGYSTSLSADGSVLAVGAYAWEGSTGTNRGGVYIYDWSGSAWVQRGSVLEASDATDSDDFGASTSLSSDGSVLVVGARSWEGSSGADRGGVYIYDWSGSAWVQRGWVLVASDAEDSDDFGASTSLSSDGSVLVVGAYAWEGVSGTDRGGVYTYSLVANRGPFVKTNNGIGSIVLDDNLFFSGIASAGGSTNYALRIDSKGLVYKSTSSLRYKENVLGFTDNFDLILEINPASFNFIGQNYTEIGFIAEELDAKGLSNLVIYDELGRPDGVKYEKLPIYLLEVIKRQQNDINSLYQLSNLGDLGDELHALNYLTVNNLTAESINTISIDSDTINTTSLNVSGALFSNQIEAELISASIGQNISILLSDAFGNTSFNIMNTDNVPIFSVASNGDVRINGKLAFDTESAYASVGTSILPEGSQTVMIETLACTVDSKVFITIVDEEGLDYPTVKVIEKGAGYFVISLSQELSQDIYLDWWVIN